MTISSIPPLNISTPSSAESGGYFDAKFGNINKGLSAISLAIILTSLIILWKKG